MIVLGIDTATKVCGVGLAGESGLIADYRLQQGYTHAERLAGATEMIIRDAGYTLSDLNGIAISIGPGSFTGLRIGLGFAKGLAYSLDIPIAAVSTLDALIDPAPPVCPTAWVMIPSRKGEVYRQIYTSENGSWQSDEASHEILIPDLVSELSKDAILFLGPGDDPETLSADEYKMIRRIDQIFSLTCGFHIARLGRQKILTGQTEDLDSLVPHYIKRFQGVT
ncbi:tRNA (adenosine(37)-N6)-threonylcarbamoyltransferase complex dimerization subunit type 1 TsaB [candidate division KSB1 bacterium]|nr:tRNA (adenosine(37)-N6)-threonylcarbamoyltransferase complex dimerization subunit type 1 TsaB [candidate division KSB1 bacterium]